MMYSFNIFQLSTFKTVLTLGILLILAVTIKTTISACLVLMIVFGALIWFQNIKTEQEDGMNNDMMSDENFDVISSRNCSDMRIVVDWNEPTNQIKPKYFSLKVGQGSGPTPIVQIPAGNSIKIINSTDHHLTIQTGSYSTQRIDLEPYTDKCITFTGNFGEKLILDYNIMKGNTSISEFKQWCMIV